MENVARIHSEKIDLRDHQELLLQAESTSLKSFGGVTQACSAFVKFAEDLNLSVVHPRVRRILRRMPEVVQSAAEVSLGLSDIHADAQKLAEARGDEVILSGGIPKEEIPPEFAERRL